MTKPWLLLLLVASCARGSESDLGAPHEEEIATEPTEDASSRLPPHDAARTDADTTPPNDAGTDADAGKPSTLGNGLLFHMNFDGPAPADATGNHPTSAITVSTFTPAPDRFGKPSGAARFIGTPATLIQVGPPNQMPINNAPRSLSAWVKPRISAPPATAAQPNSNVFLHWGIDDCQSKMFGLGNRLDHGFGWTGCVDIDSTLAVPVATWTFMAVTFASDGTLTLVVGTQKSTHAGVTLATPASSPLAIGGERKTYGQGFVSYFDGDLDDVRVWNRPLDDAELAILAADH